MSKPVTRSIRLKNDLFKAVTAQAAAENRTFNNMVETILRDYVESKNNA